MSAVTSLPDLQRLTGDLGLVGLEAFGKPLLYTIFALTLAAAFRTGAAPPAFDPSTPDSSPEFTSDVNVAKPKRDLPIPGVHS